MSVLAARRSPVAKFARIALHPAYIDRGANSDGRHGLNYDRRRRAYMGTYDVRRLRWRGHPLPNGAAGRPHVLKLNAWWTETHAGACIGSLLSTKCRLSLAFWLRQPFRWPLPLRL